MFPVQCYLLLLFHIVFNGEAGYTETKGEIHPIYISVIEIDHDRGESRATIRIKVFIDDLEDAIKYASGRIIKLKNKGSCNSNRELIQKYFGNHFKIRINGDNVLYELDKCEIFDDSIWLYFNSQTPLKWTQMHITADYLMELFPTQSNIVKISYGDRKVYERLTLDKVFRLIDFSH